MDADPQLSRTFVLLGPTAVGKSSFALRYVESHFVEAYAPTIEAEFEKRVIHQSQPVNLTIRDTAGQHEFSTVTMRNSTSAHGYFLMYSVDSHASFELLQKIHDKLLQLQAGDRMLQPVVVVATKSDIFSRQVPASAGKRFAEEYGYDFVECSAKDNENVEDAFQLLIDRTIRRSRTGSQTDLRQGSRCGCCKRRSNARTRLRSSRSEEAVSFGDRGVEKAFRDVRRKLLQAFPITLLAIVYTILVVLSVASYSTGHSVDAIEAVDPHAAATALRLEADATQFAACKQIYKSWSVNQAAATHNHAFGQPQPSNQHAASPAASVNVIPPTKAADHSRAANPHSTDRTIDTATNRVGSSQPGSSAISKGLSHSHSNAGSVGDRAATVGKAKSPPTPLTPTEATQAHAASNGFPRAPPYPCVLMGDDIEILNSLSVRTGAAAYGGDWTGQWVVMAFLVMTVTVQVATTGIAFMATRKESFSQLRCSNRGLFAPAIGWLAVAVSAAAAEAPPSLWSASIKSSDTAVAILVVMAVVSWSAIALIALASRQVVRHQMSLTSNSPAYLLHPPSQSPLLPRRTSSTTLASAPGF